MSARRLPLTTKQGHNYYKGTRTGSMGRHTKHGGYLVDFAKVRTYPRPVNLDTCSVRSSCALLKGSPSEVCALACALAKLTS